MDTNEIKLRMEELFEGGLRPEQWLKVWESSFPHENRQEHQDHGEVHGHGTTSDTGKHRNVLKANSYLLSNIHSLTGGNTGERVFVTLCGNTKDLEWLCSKGYSVVGAELSEIAVRQTFENACAGPIPYNVSTKGEINVYSATDGKNLKVYAGDFFKEEINPEELGKFNCIWDSHGIISLPASQQQQYADKLLAFLNPGGKILFSTADYDASKLKGKPIPPPIPCSKLVEYFPTCSVKQIEEKRLKQKLFEGVDFVNNQVVLVEAPQ